MNRRGFLAIVAVVRDDSIARLAHRELPRGTEFVLVRTAGEQVIATRWTDPASAAPLGSLVKPFLALAYGEAHAFRYPEMHCAGCWLPRGHGRLDISSALAQSCNSYFLQLARLTAAESVELVARRYGLTAPSDASPESWIGRDGRWRARPEQVAWAYNEMAQRRTEPGVAMVLGAMRRCARSGTASGVRAAVAAKTGTAACVHAEGAPGDGLTVALFPAYEPAFVLLARVHGAPGAECARRVGPFLRAALG